MVAPPSPDSPAPVAVAAAKAALRAEKAALRAELRARRQALDPALAHAWSEAAGERALELLQPKHARRVALFWSLPGEIDTRRLREGLLAAGALVLLPRLEGRGRPLAFHRWRPGDPLLEGPMGLLEPAPEAPRLRPDLVMVPLLGFDERGYRLGHGGGYYDRTLAALAAMSPPPPAVGLAFECQRVPRLPTDAHDVRLHALVTEERVRCFG
jgi:5-formyltetrahydrofolate cyclo-ligase